ncbi:MAG: PAS domain S-box protein [Candidatus Thorarchaeota archaeon]|jgi:PAS domain S-box-containing protein
MDDASDTVELVKLNEAMYKALFENTNDAVFLISLKGLHFNANKQAADMLGYEHHDLIGMSVWDVIAEEEKNKADGVLESLLAGKIILPYERYFKKSDGTVFPVEISVTLVRNSEGQPHYIQSIVRDITERRQFRTALMRSEKRHRDLITNLPEGVASVDLNEHFMFVNRAFSDLIGYSQEELLEMSASDIIDPTEKQVLALQTQQRIKGESSSYEIGMIRKDGKKITVRISAVPQKDVDGEVFGTIAVISDVTARNLAEAALAKSESQFRAAFDQAAVGVAIAAPDGTLLRTNQALEKILGYSPGEMEGINAFDIANPDERNRIMTLNREILAGVRKSYQLETQFNSRDGSQVWGRLVVSIPPQVEGFDLFAIGIFEDITERKQAEEEIRKLTRAIEQSPASVVITDVEGTIEYVNPAFAKLTYYGSDEAVGQNPRILKTEMTPDETHIQLWETITSGKTWNGVFANKKKNGEIYWEDAYISPIFDNDNTITHYVAVKVDITQQREAQEQLQASNDELELYTSFLQHDLRNDLQVLMSNGETGLLVSEEENPLRNYVEVIMATSERMKRILDAFGYPNEILQANLLNLIKGVAEQAQKAHPNLKIHVRNLGIPDEFRILRSKLLPIVFDNLFRNSARFGGKRVNVDVELSQIDNQVQVIILDDGPGIPEEINPKLFRKGVSTSGSGYGLYLTKKLIEGYNGTISLIESEKGEGAKFRILLPLR